MRFPSPAPVTLFLSNHLAIGRAAKGGIKDQNELRGWQARFGHCDGLGKPPWIHGERNCGRPQRCLKPLQGALLPREQLLEPAVDRRITPKYPYSIIRHQF
jgi:hypothetical protein